MENKTLNRITLAIFAPLLMLTGIAGFLIPRQYQLMSGETPYNLFHLIFGALGLFLVTATTSDLVGKRRRIPGFNNRVPERAR